MKKNSTLSIIIDLILTGAYLLLLLFSTTSDELKMVHMSLVFNSFVVLLLLVQFIKRDVTLLAFLLSVILGIPLLGSSIIFGDVYEFLLATPWSLFFLLIIHHIFVKGGNKK